MPKLYEIRDQIEKILNDSIDRETGEIQPEVLLQLEQLEISLEEKALNVALYAQGQILEAKSVRAAAEPFRQHLEDLESRARAHENHAKGLLEYLGYNVPRDKDWKLRSPQISIGWRESVSVVTTPMATNKLGEPIFEQIDPEYVVTKVTQRVNKADAMRVMKEGKVVHGLELHRRSYIAVGPGGRARKKTEETPEG